MLKEHNRQSQPAIDWQTLINIGDNLYRSSKSGKYYAIFKRNGKQIRRSLKTTDKQLAQRKLAELRDRVDQLDTDTSAKVAFSIFDGKGNVVGGLLRQYIDNKLGNVLPRTRELNIADTKTFAVAFNVKPVRNITLKDVETWAAKRQREVSSATFNRQLGLLKRVFAYATMHGIRVDNPAEKTDRAQHQHTEPVIPTRQQFIKLISELREISENATDFIEAMAYSGCRVSELGGDSKWGYPPLRWQNVNFPSLTFTVIGKGRKTRTVPLFPAFRELLLRIRKQLPSPPEPTDRVFSIEDPRASLSNACKKLGWNISNHDFRHFFCSNCIELGIDFKVIAAWLGHSDGGILVAKTYGHLRQEHSMQMATRMTFSMTEKPASNIVDITRKPNSTTDSNDHAGSSNDADSATGT